VVPDEYGEARDSNVLFIYPSNSPMTIWRELLTVVICLSMSISHSADYGTERVILLTIG
jgi:hypothetical protein